VAWELANNAADILITENIARQQAQQQQLQSQRDPAQTTERQKLVDLQTLLEDEVTQYEDEIDELQIQLAALQPKQDTPSVERRQEVRGDLASARSLRLQALSSLAETQSTLAATADTAISADTAVVVDAAPLPSRPLSSRMLLSVLLGMIVGLMGALGIAFLREYLDYTVKTPEMLDAVYAMATQGVIGVVPTKKDSNATYSLVTVTDAHSPTAESFRSLRTGIQISGVDSALKSVLVTSAGPGEGKTFVAANLAVTMAQLGKRVILVDTDLRRPMVHEVFGILRTVGLTNYVAQQNYDLDDIIRPTHIENLSVVTSGVLPPNPSELLASKRMLSLMKGLEKRADFIIYDTPPAATVTDAAILAPHVDGVLQVVRAGATRIDLVLRCKALLERVGARVLGPVLNQVNLQDMGYYAYYYQSGYSSDDPPPPSTPKGLRRFLPGRRRLTKEQPRSLVSNTIPAVLDQNPSQD
ncbi:MAG: polysaccharide biosynthesis tyrosine autokinase, partial [Herpetosiphonaceae bacterium]|nr:polysaccharide biosynthesis tyrosine autokinase [Herpetosiphonaceae bacterium]